MGDIMRHPWRMSHYAVAAVPFIQWFIQMVAPSLLSHLPSGFSTFSSASVVGLITTPLVLILFGWFGAQEATTCFSDIVSFFFLINNVIVFFHCIFSGC